MNEEPETDIAQIFARNPHDCTDKDIMVVITEYRKKKHLFESAGVPAPGKPRAKKGPSVPIDLSKLGL